MTQSNTLRETQVLVQEGNAALRAGDILEASKRFRRATELEPENIEAWLGLASAVRSYREKNELLQRALSIDPTNADVLSSLAYVQGKLSAGELLAPRSEPGVGQPAMPAEAGDMPISPASGVETTFCYRHPERETGLRCVQCGRPICTECVRPAFVGQLCPECARERRPRNYQVTAGGLVLAGVITLVASVIISYPVTRFLGGLFFAYIVAVIGAPIVAEMIVRLLDRATHAKRGREMQLTVGISYALGTLPWVLFSFQYPGSPPLPLLLFTGVAIATLVGRLR